jgi:hypothetical protein
MRAAFPPILDRIADKAEVLKGIEAEPDAVRENAEMCRALWLKLSGLDA